MRERGLGDRDVLFPQFPLEGFELFTQGLKMVEQVIDGMRHRVRQVRGQTVGGETQPAGDGLAAGRLLALVATERL